MLPTEPRNGTVLIQRAEGASLAALAWVVLVHLGFAWWWPLAVFLLYDLSALGYLMNSRVGAVAYNVVHSLVGPCLLGVAAIASAVDELGLVALTWLIHVGIDRALGYGLKEPDAFRHTHLGWIGGAAQS